MNKQLEADLKKAQEQLPGLEHDVSKLTSQLQLAQIALDKCKEDIRILSEQLGA